MKKHRRPRKLRGLGDAFALVAQPTARIIDAIAGTNLKNCGACKSRQADWNQKVPFREL
jgi:hypothetical protein